MLVSWLQVEDRTLQYGFFSFLLYVHTEASFLLLIIQTNILEYNETNS